MKIQCNVCQVAEATVLCCADEAALCSNCDRQVHAANKLASKHERVPLLANSSSMPKCDICQELVGYFFCLEDRALMCRKCDVAIHTVNPYVSSHQRFLLTGLRVGLEPSELSPSSSMGNSPSAEKVSIKRARSGPKTSAPVSMSSLYDNIMPLSREYAKAFPVQDGAVGDYTRSKLSFVGDSDICSLPPWHVDDSAGLSEFNHNFEYADHGSSKAGNGKFGGSDSSIAISPEETLDLEKCLNHVPDIAWIVPQVAKGTTISELNEPKTSQELTDSSAFVPEIC